MTDPLVEEGLEYFEKAGDDGDKAYVAAIRAKLAQARARIARLELTLRHTADGVHSLDEARAFARKALNESEPQSHATVKAEALREAAGKLIKLGQDGVPYFSRWLKHEADRIEKESES